MKLAERGMAAFEQWRGEEISTGKSAPVAEIKRNLSE
jgi:hypothetical protein